MANPPRIGIILVGTDFSDTGEAAVAWAAELARQHAAQLVLCHALMPATTTAPAPEFVPLPARFYEELRTTAAERLASAAADLRRSGLAVETTLVIGAAAPTIIAEAEKCGAALIVVGTRGLTGWKRILLGSTAAHVVREARCPVLTVRPEDVGRHRAVRTVLVPTDFSQDATLAAQAAQRVVHTTAAARLVLLHVYHVPVEFVVPLPAPVLLEDMTQVEAAARIEIEDVAGHLRGTGLTVETRICEGYPPETIVEEARALGADLIAMGTHGRSGLKRLLLGSTAERVLPAAPCPVLTVRRPPGV